MLSPEYTKTFERDVKRLKRAHRDLDPLKTAIRLVLEDSLAAREELVRRHNMHTLSGKWTGSNECHVCNAGDWLLVWAVGNGIAYFQRTGSHDEIFRN